MQLAPGAPHWTSGENMHYARRWVDEEPAMALISVGHPCAGTLPDTWSSMESILYLSAASNHLTGTLTHALLLRLVIIAACARSCRYLLVLHHQLVVPCRYLARSMGHLEKVRDIATPAQPYKRCLIGQCLPCATCFQNWDGTKPLPTDI